MAARLADTLASRFDGLKVAGHYTPPFRPLNEDEERELVALVAERKPSIIWVGLGAPKQERFMHTYLPKLDTCLMVGVGAAFDFHTGRVPQAPRWMQRSGLEWAFRLATEPKRLWWRYLKHNTRFLGRIALAGAGIDAALDVFRHHDAVIDEKAERDDHRRDGNALQVDGEEPHDDDRKQHG